MTRYASAGRYARALLDVILKEAAPEQAEQELAAYVELINQQDDLRRVLLNPAVPVTGKRGIIAELNARMKPSAPVAKLMVLLAERGRLELLPDLLRAYRNYLMEYLQIVRAEIVTATPLADGRVQQLQHRLAQVTGRKVTMTTKVDPSIVGGIVARVGSTVYDGSVDTQLARMRERLAEEV
jgi:F-type H+-transporting ATPase subunit delta